MNCMVTFICVGTKQLLTKIYFQLPHYLTNMQAVVLSPAKVGKRRPFFEDGHTTLE